MPMPAKGPRLYLRKRKGRRPTWVIKDTGQPEYSTGTEDRGQAEAILAECIERKHRARGPVHAEGMTCGDALAIYGEEHAPHVVDSERIAYAIQALLPYWGGQAVSAVKGATCRRYAAMRPVQASTTRRELGTLSAALNYCVKEGYLLTAPPVTLPEKPETSQRAMTRGEVARLLWAARRSPTSLISSCALYTGTRRDAVLGLRLSGPSMVGGWFDLDAGVMYRCGEGERVTKKRRTPVKLPRQLLAHAIRWDRMGYTWAVEFRGARVASIKTAWRNVVSAADLGRRPTPHTLKHTAIIWAVRGGADKTELAEFFATSMKTIEDTYWHHSPKSQAGAVKAMEG
ncbi:MAG: integrase [Rhodobacter sp.]|nr:integrase [Rhodobacter sp.]